MWSRSTRQMLSQGINNLTLQNNTLASIIYLRNQHTHTHKKNKTLCKSMLTKMEAIYSFIFLPSSPPPPPTVYLNGRNKRCQVALNLIGLDSIYAGADWETNREVVRRVYREAVRRVHREAVRRVYREAVRRVYREAVRRVYREAVRRVYREAVRRVYREAVRRVYREAVRRVYREAVRRVYREAVRRVYREAVRRVYREAVRRVYREVVRRVYREVVRRVYREVVRRVYRAPFEICVRSSAQVKAIAPRGQHHWLPSPMADALDKLPLSWYPVPPRGLRYLYIGTHTDTHRYTPIHTHMSTSYTQLYSLPAYK